MEQKDYTNDAVALLKELIAIPSISRDETKAADKLSEYLNKWNLPHGREGNNLWVGCPDWDNNRLGQQPSDGDAQCAHRHRETRVVMDT